MEACPNFSKMSLKQGVRFFRGHLFSSIAKFTTSLKTSWGNNTPIYLKFKIICRFLNEKDR